MEKGRLLHFIPTADLTSTPCPSKPQALSLFLQQPSLNSASHFSVNTVMTEQSEQLLYMDIVGPSRVHSIRDKWYVLIIVDDYSRYS
jgi:hypothetical protein